MKIVKPVVGIVAALAIGGASGAFASDLAVSAHKASVSTPDYPENPSGQTYGSAMEAQRPQDEPDLVLVVTDQGGEGYVRQTDLSIEFRNPADAVAFDKATDGDVRSVTAFQSDGKTVVGTFTISDEL